MSVKKQEITIAVAGQRTQAFLYSQEGEARPGVLLYTDIFGIRPVAHAQAARLAEAGFTVLLPHVFFRAGPTPLFDPPFQPGEERSMRRMQQLRDSLTPEMQLADARDYGKALADQKEVRSGPLAAVGYCYTGGMAVRTAAACPDTVRAAASFHAGNLVTDQPTSVPLLLPKVNAALYFGHAVEDRSMPAEAIETLGAALRAWGGIYVNQTYAGAKHGWTKSDSPVYDREQAEAAFAALVAFLKENVYK